MSDAASVLTLPLYQARADTNATIYLPNSVPTYSRQNTTTRTQTPRSEHLFELRNGSKAWALLKVSSNAPSPKSLPVFFEGENVDCMLVLRAGSRGESSIQTIKATVSVPLFRPRLHTQVILMDRCLVKLLLVQDQKIYTIFSRLFIQFGQKLHPVLLPRMTTLVVPS